MDETTTAARALRQVRAITGAIAAINPWSKKQPNGLTEATGSATPPDKIIPSACRLCYGRCGILGYIRDGRVVKIEGNPAIPSNAGTLCSRAYSIPQLMYSPYRLQYPLKRVGVRGEVNGNVSRGMKRLTPLRPRSKKSRKNTAVTPSFISMAPAEIYIHSTRSTVFSWSWEVRQHLG